DAVPAARIPGGAVVMHGPAVLERSHDEQHRRVSLDDVWRALALVPDPEIPVISIVELGIVREVVWRGSAVEVRVTPTYSGCPATDVIAGDIVTAIRAIGVDDVRVATQLSPPWTTDWMAPGAKEKLSAYGIVPP